MISTFHKIKIEWADDHFIAVNNYFKKSKFKTAYEKVNIFLEIISGYTLDIKKVVTANTQELKDIILLLEGKPKIKEFEIFKNVYNSTFSSSTASSLKLNGDNYSSYHFVKRLDVKVCPYCNRNFIFNIPTSGSDKRRLSELDHFYPKDTYPLLAMSFYNLVPVCHNCNHIKSSSKVPFFHPYDNFNSSDLIKFKIKVLHSDFIFNKRSYKLQYYATTEYKKMFKELKLDRIYPIHKDITSDIIFRKYIYHDEYISDLLMVLNNKINKDEFLNLILSVNMEEERLNERPFSKLTKDIWEDLDGKLDINN